VELGENRVIGLISPAMQMPPSVNLQSLPAQAQQILNEMMNQISSAVPMIGFDIRPYGAKWNEEADRHGSN
jgi:hypothetical protein